MLPPLLLRRLSPRSAPLLAPMPSPSTAND
jgi:hypothetical protein